jgi:glycosyltransferase involved in cell wall biosynthesis
LEGRLEGRILAEARVVFVTSEQWKALLVARRPELASKVTVLTNGYPPALVQAPVRPPAGPLVLLHAGRFSGSRPVQRVGALLAPLAAVGPGEVSGRIRLRGALELEDALDAGRWASRLASAGWVLETEPPVARLDLLPELAAADGLLLLAISPSAVPSKLFEYLAAGRPILAVTPRDGAVWTIGACLPQMFLLDPADASASANVVPAFLDACRSRGRNYPLPEEFSEPALAARFHEALRRAAPPTV